MTLAQCLMKLTPSAAYDLRSLFEGSGKEEDDEKVSAGSVVATVARDLDLPETGATLPLQKLLSKKTIDQWCDPAFMYRVPTTPLPTPAILCSKLEWLKILRRMHLAGLCLFYDLCDIACDATGELLKAGLFGILKANGLIRLILDRRVPNMHEIALAGLRLPHAACFTRFRLEVKEVLRLNLRDASNFYLLLRVPKARLPFQAAGESVSRRWVEAGMPELKSASDVSAVYDDPDQMQPVMTFLMPGDLNAVLATQEAHYNLVMQDNGLCEDELVVYGVAAPEGKTWGGIYIDDLATVQALPEKDFLATTPCRDTEILEAADTVYKEWKVPQKASKQITGEAGGTVWGASGGSCRDWDGEVVGAHPTFIGPCLCRLHF